MVRVYNEWNEDIENYWKQLQRDSSTHPQSYLEWVKSWSQYRINERNELFLIMCTSKSGVCIAPFVKQKRNGLTTLLSIPHHFGDRFDFLADGNCSILYEEMIEYLLSYQSWDFVQLRNVLENTELFCYLRRINVPRIKVGEQILTALSTQSFEEYLKALNRKVRSEYRRRWKKLNGQGDVKVEVSREFKDYLSWEKQFINIQTNRSKTAERSIADYTTYEYRKMALEGLHKYGIPIYIVVKINNEIIAYRIGLVDDKNCYHDFKLSFSPEYGKYGLGGILNAELIKYSLISNFMSINHGMGNYSYKKDWSVEYEVLSSFDFYLSSSSLIAKVNLLWTTKLRKALKQIFHEVAQGKLSTLWNTWIIFKDN